ncbi:hypothetical protein PMAYCL1PPCAC_00571, partial [Pristionchus mayeri]
KGCFEDSFFFYFLTSVEYPDDSISSFTLEELRDLNGEDAPFSGPSGTVPPEKRLTQELMKMLSIQE